MFKLKYGYFISGLTIGFYLLFSFVVSLPDGKLHIVYCDVGQGDATYIRFPDGRDMLVDGGPGSKVIGCLGKYMPFWDKHIDMVIATHPDRDHIEGLIAVIDRFTIGHFIRSDIESSSELYKTLIDATVQKQLNVRFVTAGESITIGPTTLSVIWPTQGFVARGKSQLASAKVKGATTDQATNDYSVVFFLRYGSFDALFTADADSRVDKGYAGMKLADDRVEVLKLPHHGSKTGMSDSFLRWMNPELTVVSVGKNSYGHPTQEALTSIDDADTELIRTDEVGDIEIVSDGQTWTLVN